MFSYFVTIIRNSVLSHPNIIKGAGRPLGPVVNWFVAPSKIQDRIDLSTINPSVRQVRNQLIQGSTICQENHEAADSPSQAGQRVTLE